MEDIFDEMNLLVYSGSVDIRMEKETTPESFAESKELLEDIEKQKELSEDIEKQYKVL